MSQQSSEPGHDAAAVGSGPVGAAPGGATPGGATPEVAAPGGAAPDVAATQDAGAAGSGSVGPEGLADLVGLDELPVAEHVARFEAVHEALRARLAGDSRAAGSADGGHA